MKVRVRHRIVRSMAVFWALIGFAGFGFRVLANCDSFGLPFTDLGSESNFCAAIAEAYYSGLTNGTTATTYDPGATVARRQMAAFVTRTLDQALARGSRRAALDQWWTTTPHFDQLLGTTNVSASPQLIKSDGADIWVANFGGTVQRVRASDGANLDSWTGATNGYGVLVAMGRIFITGQTTPGNLYMIDPNAVSGSVSSLSSSLGNNPAGIAFDGNDIWTANFGNGATGGSISIVVPGTWTVANHTTGLNSPRGLAFDGTNMWVTDVNGTTGLLRKLASDATVLKTVTVGKGPSLPAFDGHNIWVPNSVDNTVSVVRVSDGTVLKTIPTGGTGPAVAAFDGERVLVTNEGTTTGDGSVSLFKATDLTLIGNATLAAAKFPFGACSDGVNFWVAFENSTNTVGRIGRF
ncbi:MAG TPA: S-layer homology domain-containing protein [Thermoanaerobaculia bacterium]|nr:S-layer homology domain-containing protein [Thermoanaerobaculia bacterium]